MTYEELLAKHSKIIEDAFLSSIEKIKSSAILSVVEARIAAGDIQGAINALQVEPEAFAALERAIQDTFADGGLSAIEELPSLRTPDGPAVIWQFSIRNLAAEALLASQSANLIQEIVNDQKELIRSALVRGLGIGQNPKTTALDLVGRVNIRTGQREGGSIGLHSNQEAWVASYREDLLSGDASRMRGTLGRALRDKRFDRTVAKAVRDGVALDRATVNKMVRAYRIKALKYRGNVIGLEETRTALINAKKNAMDQQISSGKVSAENVRKRWKHFGSEHPRLQHQALNNVEKNYNEPYIMPDGTRMDRPHDDNAPAEHVINCKCQIDYRIDYIAEGLRKYKARRNG